MLSHEKHFCSSSCNRSLTHDKQLAHSSYKLRPPRQRHAFHIAPSAQAEVAASLPADDGHQSSINSSGTSTTNGRRSRYLTFDEYVALREQQQASQQAACGDTAAGQDSDNAVTEGDAPKKRVPWNKGRKHSALTIARITQGVARAMERPEVRAKVDAWNSSRVGVPLPEEMKERIRRGSMEARRQQLQDISPEAMQAWRAAAAERSKQLWQNPEYVAKQAAAAEKRRAMKAAKLQDPEYVARQEAKRQAAAAKKAASRQAAAAKRLAAAGIMRQQQQFSQSGDTSSSGRQPTARARKQAAQPKPKQLSKKALADAAAKLKQELQDNVHRLLKTQQLIPQTEGMVAALQSSLQALENDPQRYQVAAGTLQQAQAYLLMARNQVAELQQLLDRNGVEWDSSTGQITRMLGPPEQRQQMQQQAGVMETGLEDEDGSSRSSRSASRRTPRKGSSSGSSGSSRGAADIVRSNRSSRAGGPSSSTSGSSSSSSGIGNVGPDVVRSSRRVGGSAASPAGTSSGKPAGKSSSGGRAARAAAEAASSGGSRSSSSSSSSSSAAWQVRPSQQQVNNELDGSRQNGHHSMNGHGLNGRNGYSSNSSEEGTRYVTVRVQHPLEEDIEDEL